jgi:hypothetical protein
MKSVYTFLIIAIVAIAVMSPLNISSNEPLEVLQQFFHSRGFACGDIALPHLGITVKLEKNQFYIKEENVRDIPRRIKEIREIFGYKGPLPEPAPCCGWCGVVSVEYKGQEGYGYVVLVKKKINDFTHVYTHAHENGHFLWYIGKQDIIYQMFSNPGYICSQISNNDEFAELCGWLAAKRAGFDLRKCTIQNLQNRERKSIERIKKLIWKSAK